MILSEKGFWAALAFDLVVVQSMLIKKLFPLERFLEKKFNAMNVFAMETPSYKPYCFNKSGP